MWDCGIGVEIEEAFALLMGCLSMADGDADAFMVDPASSYAVLEAREASDPEYAARMRRSREDGRRARMAADPAYAERRKRQKREASRRSELKRLARQRAERAAARRAS